MPSGDILSTFFDSVLERLTKPITSYYDVIDKFGPDSIQAVIAQSLTRAEEDRVLRSVHIQAGLIASAGNLSGEQLSQLDKLIATDEQYMSGFMDALPSLSRAQALNRAQMYANTVKNTISVVETVDFPLPIRPRDGQTQCTWHCRCGLNVVYLFGSGNVDVYWLLDQAGGVEHCPDCLQLASTWRPLRIRNGVIVGTKMISDHDFEHLKHALLNSLRIAA